MPPARPEPGWALRCVLGTLKSSDRPRSDLPTARPPDGPTARPIDRPTNRPTSSDRPTARAPSDARPPIRPPDCPSDDRPSDRPPESPTARPSERPIVPSSSHPTDSTDSTAPPFDRPTARPSSRPTCAPSSEDSKAWQWEGKLPAASDTPERQGLYDAGFRPVECEPGDLVVIHGSVDHLSLANTSGRQRETFQLHLVEGPSEGVTWSPRNWLQYPTGKAFPSLRADGANDRKRKADAL